MSIRLRTLILIMVVGFMIMEITANPTLDGGGIFFSAIFCAAMVGLIYWHAITQKEKISGGTLFLHSLVASIASSVALMILLYVAMLFFGIDLFDVLGSKMIPVVILLAAVFCFPIFLSVLKS